MPGRHIVISENATYFGPNVKVVRGRWRDGLEGFKMSTLHTSSIPHIMITDYVLSSLSHSREIMNHFTNTTSMIIRFFSTNNESITLQLQQLHLTQLSVLCRYLLKARPLVCFFTKNDAIIDLLWNLMYLCLARESRWH